MNAPLRDQKPDYVAIYKRLLGEVLDRRPSGTRQRLATALGKNRSFISQISNPIYPIPVPAQHLPVIFDICHFSGAEKQAFLAAYRSAHPRRVHAVQATPATRRITVEVPDLGEAGRTQALDELMGEMAQRIAQLLQDK
jgi:hypothetical protein